MMQAAPTSDTEKTTASRCTQTVAAPNPLSAAPPGHQKLARMQRAFGNQAVLRMLVKSSPREALQRKCACGGKCSGCAATIETARRSAFDKSQAHGVPAIVRDVLHSPGQPLDSATRDFMEPRFGHDFSQVQIHTDRTAAQSAAAVNALAYTVGRDVVFAAGEYQPATDKGRRVIAHELAHVVQQGGRRYAHAESVSGENDLSEREADHASAAVLSVPNETPLIAEPQAGVGRLQRTPARQVSCGAHPPLVLPDRTTIADPVGVITAAEDRAAELLDNAIDELSATRAKILAGAPVASPTISDGLVEALGLIGLDATTERAWTRTGYYTVELVVRRLRLIRRSIGSFFFTCLSGDCGTDEAFTRGSGEFHTRLCVPFWDPAQSDAENQATIILHEACHNFADFVGDTGREGNAYCYTRLVHMVGAVDVAHQRTDRCPDVT